MSQGNSFCDTRCVTVFIYKLCVAELMGFTLRFSYMIHYVSSYSLYIVLLNTEIRHVCTQTSASCIRLCTRCTSSCQYEYPT
ncbi:hypothetical protein THOE12_110059 [Vibrio rotiferianus]|nr:hypothetical protein THOE12_110059 [Vibrio rotiferianus]